MFDIFLDGLIDALIDNVKILPFLGIIYILLELFDRRSGTRVYKWIKKADKFAPLLGGAIGVIPQCGLSAAAATLYSGRVISVGTMLAVFLSTSDDMIPIFLTASFPLSRMFKILGFKMLIAIVSGYAINVIWKVCNKEVQTKKPVKMMGARQIKKSEEMEICTASCCRGNFWIAVLKHVAQIFFFILLVSIVLNFVIGIIGEDRLANCFNNIPIIAEFIAALIGLIPNCASSVIITQLYLSGVMGAGGLFAGLLVNAGIGTLALFKTNKNKKENLKILGILYSTGVFWGIIIELVGMTF